MPSLDKWQTQCLGARDELDVNDGRYTEITLKLQTWIEVAGFGVAAPAGNNLPWSHLASVTQRARAAGRIESRLWIFL